MNDSFRVLLVEDLPTDAELCEREVRSALGSCEFLRVEDRDEYIAALRDFDPSLIISDFRLPRFDGMTALKLAKDLAADVPFIILTGSMNEDTAVECMRAGAWDYVIKEHFKRLGPAVRSALEQGEVRRRRRLAEDALWESEQRLRDAQRLGRIGHWDYDVQTRRIRWSDMVYSIYGRDRKLGPPSEEEELSYYSPKDAELLRECARRTVETGESYEVDVSINMPEGRVVHVAAVGSAVKDSAGNVVRLLGTVQDITERRRAEDLMAVRLRLYEFAATHSVKELLQRTLDEAESITGSRIGFYHFLSEDQRTVSLRGWSSRTDMECRGVEGTGEHYPIEKAGVWADCLRQRRPVVHNDYSKLIHRKGLPSGHVVLIRELVVPIFRKERIVAVLGVGNKPTGYSDDDVKTLDFLSDVAWSIVEYKMVEAEREQLLANLAQSDRLASMGMLAAGVAHEINNPLAYTLYNLESLIEDLPRLSDVLGRCMKAARRCLGEAEWDRLLVSDRELLDPSMLDDINDRFKDALQGAERIKDIARALGTFSRVEKDRLVEVDLMHPIEAAVNMAFNEIKYRARLVKDYHNVAPIMANDGRLCQVFLNLLINAAHAIPEGEVEGNEIRISTWQKGEEVFAEVKDTGHGVPEENIQRMFEPFFTTKKAGMGTGLGLAICRNIIESHGGRIEVKSEVGKGTSFLVRLPVRKIERRKSSTEEIVVTSLSESRRGRILIVDDEPAIRSILMRMLGRDHDVVEADSGSRARDILAKDEEFDVILCDLMMPDLSGIDLHAWLAERNRALANRVVFITGGVFTPRANEYLNQSLNARIEKPFEEASMKKTIREIMVAAGRNRQRTV